MKHTDYTGAYEALMKAELEELAAAVKAHGGVYRFENGEDDDESADPPVISAIPRNGYNAEEFRVTQAILSDSGVRVFGIPVDGYEECELDADMVMAGQVGYITDAIPETEAVEDVSASKTKVYVAFGTEAVRNINSGDIDAIPDCDIEDPDMFRIREFDTVAEAEAYKKGLDDADGWRDYAILSPLDTTECRLIKKVDERQETVSLRYLWDRFADIPVNGEDEIEEKFMSFEPGTSKFDVWHWFDERCPNGLAVDLMGETPKDKDALQE